MLNNYNKGGELVPNAISKWIFLDHRSIILKYNSIVNGLLNYYSFVDNFYEFHTIINFILRHSCAKTLTRKLNLKSKRAVFKKFYSALNLLHLKLKKLKPMKFKMLERYKIPEIST